MPDVPEPTVPLPSPGWVGAVQPSAAPAADGAVPQVLRSPLTNGQRWKQYQIGDPIETSVGWCYQAVNAGTLEDVHIRVLPYAGPGDVRAQAWDELQSLDHRSMVRGIEAIIEGEFRFEISTPPPATKLHEWAAARQATLEDIHTLVQQIGDVLTALHDRGLVHLNLRPDIIYLPSEGAGLHVMIGGLERVTIYNQGDLVSVPVDPLYAPPEAAGLTKHSPGAGLRGWDWWSLGRILQELVLGRHVLGLVMNREVSRLSPDVRARAEALLLERDPKAPRAGAVELMPSMSQRLTDLMRGLLTSSRDGRWGADEIQRWLKQQPVKDRYQLGRNEQLFAWKDRMFTISEAAEYFSFEDHWSEGVTNLFAEDDPTTLVYFVGDRPEYKQVRERINELHKFVQIPNWKDLSREACQTAVAAAAWLLLGGEDARLALFGHRIDASCIKGLFARSGVAEGVAVVKAITALPYIQMIEQNDPDAARLLSSLASILNGDSVTKALSQGWLELSNPADYARLVLLAMESDRKLLDLRTGLQERFACTRDANIQALFVQPKLTRPDLVVLASTAAQPERYGYVTHDEWKRERLEELRQRHATVAKALFWTRLGVALRLGYVLFGPWYLVLGIWLAASVAAGWPFGRLHLPLWLVGGLAALGVLRIGATLWIRLVVKKHDAAAAPWGFLSPIARCSQEARRVMGSDAAPHGHSLGNELARIRQEVAALAIKPAPAPFPGPGFVAPGWVGTGLTWSLFLAGLCFGYFRPTSVVEVPVVDPKAAVAKAIENAMAPSAQEEKPTPEEMFYDDPNAPRVPWKVSKPASAQSAAITRLKPATSDEVALALVEGQRLLLPYQRSTIDSVIAVPLGNTPGSGLMLYDGRNRRVIAKSVVMPSQMPTEKSWFEIDRLKIFYAGQPPPPPAPPPKPVVDPQKPLDTSDMPEREIRRGAYQEPSPSAQQKASNAQPLSDALDTMTP
ncbi:MAG: hypothetical protein QM790_02340 [Nibricoccus sp.]